MAHLKALQRHQLISSHPITVFFKSSRFGSRYVSKIEAIFMTDTTSQFRAEASRRLEGEKKLENGLQGSVL